MEISHTLIVALMYVTILSFGIAGLLGSLAAILNKRNDIHSSSVQLHWILIILVVHFNMAWHAVFLTNIATWTYYAFLIIVAGPILAFFITTILAPGEGVDENKELLVERFMDLRPQLLILFSLLQVWAILTDYVLDRGFTGSSVANMALVLLAVFLIYSRSYRMQKIGLAAVGPCISAVLC